jgi:hypothetical protein
MPVKPVDFAVVAVELSSLVRRRLRGFGFQVIPVAPLMGHMRLLLLILAMAFVGATVAAEEDSPRIKRRPPSPTEAAQIASDVALSDSLLRKGDIVVTNRGFFIFRGIGADGISNDFVPVPNPMPGAQR